MEIHLTPSTSRGAVAAFVGALLLSSTSLFAQGWTRAYSAPTAGQNAISQLSEVDGDYVVEFAAHAQQQAVTWRVSGVDGTPLATGQVEVPCSGDELAHTANGEYGAPVGVRESYTATAADPYPNPAHQELTIQLATPLTAAGAECRLLDMQGRIVKQ